MTDRISAFVVTLDEDIREDDVAPILNAILQLRHVISVDPVVSDVTGLIAQVRANSEWKDKLIDLIRGHTE